MPASHPTALAFLAAMEADIASDRTAAQDVLRRNLITALHAVPGLSKMHITYSRGMTRIADRTMTIAIDGWSPTLHFVSMSHVVGLGAAIDDASVQAAIPKVADVIGRLATRADDGARHGATKPLEMRNGPDVSHLYVDRALAGMIVVPESCRNGARSAVRDVHKPSGGGASCVSHMGTLRARIVERRYDEGFRREVGWTWSITNSDGPTYDGAVLSLKAGPLPEMLTAAMPGRPLRDLALVHRALDDRIVRDLYRDDLGGGQTLYTATFEPDLVKLADLDWPTFK